MELLNAGLDGLYALVPNCFVIVISIYIVMMVLMRSHVVCHTNIFLEHCQLVSREMGEGSKIQGFFVLNGNPHSGIPNLCKKEPTLYLPPSIAPFCHQYLSNTDLITQMLHRKAKFSTDRDNNYLLRFMWRKLHSSKWTHVFSILPEPLPSKCRLHLHHLTAHRHCYQIENIEYGH